MAEMSIKKRPKNLDLTTIRLPLPGKVSILHRVSGAGLFLLLPWLIGQPLDTLLELLALCSALSVSAMSGREADTTGDALAAAVGLDMADWWTPTAGSYLAQVPKARIVEAVTEAVSIEKAAPLAKLKKGEAVAAAEALLQGTRWLPSPLRARGTAAP